MAHVEPVVSADHSVVAHVVKLGIIVLPWLDVNVPEGKVPAWHGFGAVQPYDAVEGGRSGDVFKVDIVPFEQASIAAFSLVVQQVGETAFSACPPPRSQAGN